jgi:hypothetical protein
MWQAPHNRQTVVCTSQQRPIDAAPGFGETCSPSKDASTCAHDCDKTRAADRTLHHTEAVLIQPNDAASINRARYDARCLVYKRALPWKALQAACRGSAAGSALAESITP